METRNWGLQIDDGKVTVITLSPWSAAPSLPGFVCKGTEERACSLCGQHCTLLPLGRNRGEEELLLDGVQPLTSISQRRATAAAPPLGEGESAASTPTAWAVAGLPHVVHLWCKDDCGC
ncbi:hypothetical protein MUK42_28689 [Musa troglodytarum]|uniref:Uncharacterized protein n=1 Tax=Musa troglodytarum TaxID=320322 RepID=A0A9E7JVM6_9LILI|nr:hypothetical protein MUK42_28689 [Musa troglodytarum]